uniref:Uncharacterized protein n=1 Tax=Anguilla anguilla TaxID=7936 RepID=A0A0E9SPQ0_ANGAN
MAIGSLISLKSGCFGIFFFKILSQCSRTPLLSITCIDCDTRNGMFREEHSNHIFVILHLKRLKAMAMVCSLNILPDLTADW